MTDPRPTDLGKPKGARFQADGTAPPRRLYAVVNGMVRETTMFPPDGARDVLEMTPETAEANGRALIEMAKIARGGNRT